MTFKRSDRDPGEVARRLRQARQDAGFETPRKFAEKAEVSLVTYYHHENGRRPLTRESAAIYAPHLNVSPAMLLWGDSLQVPPQARIIGTLKKGGRIAVIRNGRRPLVVPVTDGLDGDVVAILVADDDNLPTYRRGDAVICRPLSRDGTYDRWAVDGMDCVVRLAKGGKLIATVSIGQTGAVTLTSHGGRVIKNAAITGAEPILFVKKMQRDRQSERLAA